MKVMLVENDDATAKTIILSLASEGITVDHYKRGADGFEISRFYRQNYDMMILDIMLDDMDGYEVLLRLRSAKIKIPVLILSGLSSSDHKIKALGFGADDYMIKPYNKGELIARIHAIVRRSKGHSESVVRFDKVSLNLDTRIVEVDGKPVHLTNKEYAILELLAMRKGTVLTKDMFLNHLYGGMDEPEIKIIDVFVCKLRKKLADAAGGTNYIDTVWGRGYMLKEFDHPETNTTLTTPQTMVSDVTTDTATEENKPLVTEQ
jgi:two-component system cell cycle response regulator CtrA